MVPDTYQQAWQTQASGTRMVVDADLLLREVQHSQRNFRTMIFHRDLREVVVGLVMIPVWFYLGARFSLPWSWYLTVPAFAWVFGFILVDRARQRQQASPPGEPLLLCVRESLAQVEHQIWLLRNVVWWYLLPFTIPLLAFFGQVAWRTAQGWLGVAVAFALPAAFVLALYYWIYRLNQSAVRSQLEPRRQELLALLAGLGDEATGGDHPDGVKHDVPGESAAAASPPSIDRRHTLRGAIAGVVLLAAITALASIAAYFFGRQGADYPKQSPFAAVRWEESQPLVRVGDQWFRLVSLDDLPAAKIVAFSQQTYGELWRKRFEEDLVELLARMGHPPHGSVTLVVQPLTSRQTRTLRDVPMTEANRRAIRAAAETGPRGQ